MGRRVRVAAKPGRKAHIRLPKRALDFGVRNGDCEGNRVYTVAVQQAKMEIPACMLGEVRTRNGMKNLQNKFPTAIFWPVWLAFWVCLATLGAATAKAQVAAAISGRVEDASGSAMIGVSIAVKDLETQATHTVTTDAAGNFRVLGLAPGPYEIEAEKAGFKTVIRTGINLEVGQDAAVNLRLELGTLRQQVTVSEQVSVVNTTTASVSGMVGEQQVKQLPLNGRSFDNLITLNPGAVNFTAMTYANTTTSNGNTFTVDGRRTAENLFLLNGIEYTGSSQLAITPGGVSGELLGIDAIREFNVLTDTYPAQYGKRAGAQVLIVTQSGSNQLHGSLYEFLRNSALDAKSYFAKGPSPPFEQNQFGAAAGGPLRKDRWFLFGNYEGFRQALTTSSVAVVPDAEARNGFLPDSSGVETQVPNLDSSMLPYMAFWPQPNCGELYLPSNEPSGMALSCNNPKQYIREDFGTARTDYIAGARDTITGAYTIDDGYSRLPLADPLFGSYTTLRMQVASLQETHSFSPNFLNTFRAGFSRAGWNLDPYSSASLASSLDFVTGAGPGGIVIGGGVTTTGFTALTSAGPTNNAGVWNRRNLFTYEDDVQISKGIHQFSFGVWFQRLQDNEDTASRQLGQASFSSLTTFLQGTTSTFNVVPNATELGWRSLFGAWYFQDAIQVRPNLSIRLGVRHEFTTGWNEALGRAANYLVDAANVLVTDPRVGDSAFTGNNAKLLFSPRIGLAWEPFGNEKTAVRAGFGTYYSLIDDLAFLLNADPPYNGTLTRSGALSSIVPIAPGFVPPQTCGPDIPKPCATYAPQGVQTNAKTPTVEEWNLTVERQLDPNTVVRAAYVGSHGYHGFVSVDPNTIPPQICSNPSGCQAGGVSASGAPATLANQSHVAQGTLYVPVGTRPNPYLGAGFFWFTEGNSSYNALEIGATHRLSQGFEFRANYTWSKNLDVNSALTGAQARNEAQMALERNDLSHDWGPSALDRASQASISALYVLPFGPGKRWLNAQGGFKGKLIDGWQLSGIATLLSGFPFTPLAGSNVSGDGDIRDPDRPSWNPNLSGPVILHNPHQWFNPNAFSLPAPGTYGNVGRESLTGPGLAELDFALLKNTPLSERITMQFRAEFFNIFNRVNFGAPNPTVFSRGAMSASAGLITTLSTNPRQIQFALKMIF
jgi:Carboxypeptidase regulatory-like domain